jgi:hypothetical protein
MKVTLIKATHSFGTAKTGKPFVMSSAVSLIPVELVEGDKYTCRGGGHTPYVYDVADNFAEELAARFAKDLPSSKDGLTVTYDLDTQPRERGNNIILGFIEQPKQPYVKPSSESASASAPAPVVKTSEQQQPPVVKTSV